MSGSQDEAAFELAVFCISAARGALEEGPYTASLRLLHAAERVCALSGAPDAFLDGLAARVRDDASRTYLASGQDYIALLDSLLTDVAAELCRRHAIAPAPDHGGP